MILLILSIFAGFILSTPSVHICCLVPQRKKDRTFQGFTRIFSCISIDTLMVLEKSEKKLKIFPPFVFVQNKFFFLNLKQNF